MWCAGPALQGASRRVVACVLHAQQAASPVLAQPLPLSVAARIARPVDRRTGTRVPPCARPRGARKAMLRHGTQFAALLRARGARWGISAWAARWARCRAPWGGMPRGVEWAAVCRARLGAHPLPGRTPRHKSLFPMVLTVLQSRELRRARCAARGAPTACRAPFATRALRAALPQARLRYPPMHCSWPIQAASARCARRALLARGVPPSALRARRGDCPAAQHVSAAQGLACLAPTREERWATPRFIELR